MRRFVSILLLLLLPIQFCWASAAVYCQHEAGTVTAHFGHHVHEHKAGGGDSAKKHVGLQSADDDCPVCHGEAPSLPPALVALLPAPMVSAPVYAEPARPRTAPADRPERPNWTAPA